MSRSDCHRIAEALLSGAPTPEEKGHLFSCPDCRAALRVAAAWKGLARPQDLEVAEPPSEAFVSRVVAAVRRDRGRRERWRAGLAAAAALLFFFLAGAAGQNAASAEEDYAQLEAPSSLDSLMQE